MKQTKQMSESIRLGMLLAISGGFMDAYSYIERGHVFANAQKGNILLFLHKIRGSERTFDLYYFEQYGGQRLESEARNGLFDQSRLQL